MLADLGINEEDWLATPQAVRTALMVLWQQNQLLQKQCSLYDFRLQKLQSQVAELEQLRAEVTELREQLGRNSSKTRADWPEDLAESSFGPRVRAVVGYLTGRLGLSHRDVAEAMETLHGLELGLGSVSALQKQLSAALTQPVETAHRFTHRQSIHHVDETGWPEGKKQKWLWVHATPKVTVFKIQPGRSKEDAQAVLGWKFKGIANTDRYNGYH